MEEHTMAKKFVPIELDKTRNMRFGMVALIRLEKKLGKPFAKIDFENEMTYEEVATIIWGGLVHEDPDLTPEKVAELIDDYSDIQTALKVMGEAMQEAFGDGKNAQGATTMPNGIGMLPSETGSSVE
jgi:hypothetical protein